MWLSPLKHPGMGVEGVVLGPCCCAYSPGMGEGAFPLSLSSPTPHPKVCVGWGQMKAALCRQGLPHHGGIVSIGAPNSGTRFCPLDCEGRWGGGQQAVEP